MSFKISNLSTTLTIAHHPVTLQSDELNFDASAKGFKEKLKEKLKAGIHFSIGDREISATLGQIIEWARKLESTLKIPDVFEEITGKRGEETQ